MVRNEGYKKIEMDEISDDDVELVGHTTSQRNWRGIIIALVVIVVVCALIITTIILLTPGKKDDEIAKKKFSFEDLVSRTYAPRSFSFSWMPGQAGFYHQNTDAAVFLFNCSTNSSTLVMDNSTFVELGTSSYTISADGRYALLPYNSENVFRHSRVSEYKIVNLQTKQASDVRGPGGQRKVQNALWSPTNSSLILILDNDIYYRPDVESTDWVRVTSSGIPTVIFNGIPDWVYEEEILLTDRAVWWNKEGTHFLYATFNDTDVQKFDIVYFGKPSNQYVETRKISYPKPGTANPTVTLHVYSLLTNKTVYINVPKRFLNIDHYFTTVSWQNNANVLVTWLNRAQNFSIFTICDANTGVCYENFEAMSSTGWLEVSETPLFSKSGDHYFTILPKKQGESGEYRHVAMVDASVQTSSTTTASKTFVTRGRFDVDKMLAIDDTDRLYYLAFGEDDATIKHLYRISITETSSLPECLSCSISEECKYVRASFDDDVTYFVITCLGPGVPTYTLKSVSGDFEYVLENNADKQAELSQLALPRTKYVNIPIPDWPDMKAKLLLPDGLKEDGYDKYNMLVRVYGGPDSQQVTDTFQLAWEHYLASSHNIVIAYMDSRGTGGRGDKWRHANYRNLGTTDVQDIITGARYLKQLKYINPISAIWGWSYGGFVTSSVLGQGTDVFQCGMAVAPVTDWRYYDSVYTERYMGLPTAEDNEAAYNFANVSRHAEQFKKSRFYIAHGTGDDNVHFQNTAHLIKALTEADVYFRTQVYTDEQHSLTGGNARNHNYKSLEDFLLQCYGLPPLVETETRAPIQTEDESK